MKEKRNLKSIIDENLSFGKAGFFFNKRKFADTFEEKEMVLDYLFKEKRNIDSFTIKDQKIIRRFVRELVDKLRTTIKNIQERTDIVQQSNLIVGKSFPGDPAKNENLVYFSCSRDWDKTWGVVVLP